MGFLSKLFGKKESKPSPAPEESRPSLAIPATDSYLVADKAMFYEIMQTIKTLTPEEVDAIFVLREKGRAAENPGELSAQTFERFFSDRDHVWPELDEWNAIFAQHGREPIFVHQRPETYGILEICEQLKVVDIKQAMKALDVSFPSSANKSGLAALLAEAVTPEALIECLPEWASIAEAIRRKSRQRFFNLLQATIWQRAKSRDDAERRVKTGVGWELVYWQSHEWEKTFVAVALEKNPDAVPPFFPGSKTDCVAVVPGFARKRASHEELRAAAERIRQADEAARK